MKVEFYRTLLCPRCLLAAKALKKLRAEFPEFEIETIEVILHPNRVRKAGVRSVPTLKIDDHLLADLLLTPRKIRSFLETHSNIGR